LKSPLFKIFFFALVVFLQLFVANAQILPSNITGLSVWLKSDSGVVLNGGNVSSWNDVSGNNYVFNAIGSSSRPSFVTSTNLINGKPTLSFDGVDDGLVSNKKIVLGTSGVSVYMIAKINSFTPYGMLLCYGVNSTGTWNFRLRPAEPKITFVDGSNNNGSGLANNNTNNLVTSNFEILNGSFDSVTSEWEIGENTFAKDSVTQSFTTLDSNLVTIGFRNDLFGFLSQNISEIIIFNRALTELEDDQVNNYLRNKYAPSVELGNLVKPACDTSIILNAGANFTSVVWSTGNTNNSIVISQPDTVSVSTTDVFGFISIDSVYLTTFQNPFSLNTLNDTLICNNSVVWNTNLSAQYYNFEWSNGSTDSIINISTSGFYYLSVEDTSGCIKTDSANVIIDPFASTIDLGFDTLLCAGNNISLVTGNQSGLSYLWEDGSSNNFLTIDTSGQYFVFITNTNNCVANDSIYVTIVGQAPVPNFSFIDNCEEISIQFSDSSQAQGIGGFISTWDWNFGDNTSSNAQNPNKTYSIPGLYQVSLIVTSNSGCSNSISKTINIFNKPIVDFDYSELNNNQFYFFESCLDSVPIQAWEWRKNNSLVSFGSSFNINLPYSTSVDVSLKLSNNKGCIDSLSKSIFISPSSQPVLPTNITGCSLWLRSDSNIVITGNQIESWSDISGNSYVFSSPTINSKPLLNPSNFHINNFPEVRFDGLDDGVISNKKIILGNEGATVFFVCKTNTFTPYGVLAGYGTNQTGNWNFRQRPSSANTTFVNSETNFGAGLANTNSFDPTLKNYCILQGSVNAITGEWKIGQNSFLRDSLISPFLQADSCLMTIGYRNDGIGFANINVAEVLIFNHELSVLENQQIISYLRNRYAPPVNIGPSILFACDTSVSLFANHYFPQINWSTGSNSDTILVSQPSNINVVATDVFDFVSIDSIKVKSFNSPFSIASLPDTITCNSSVMWDSGLNPSNYSFIWSDGSLNATNSINISGIYYVSAFNITGCSFQSTAANILIDNFTSTTSLGPDTLICAGNSITLVNGNQTDVSYLWNDSSTNSSLIINSSGQYWITASNANNCVAEDTINVTVVGQAPVTGFENGFTCQNNLVAFNDTSFATSGSTITNWFWNFGDASATNDTSILAQTNYTYSDTGSYTISLTVTTNAGCKQNLTKNIFIYPKPIVDFTNIIACKNDTAFFNDAINPLGYPITNYQWNFGDGATATSSDTFHIFSQNINYQVQLIATNSQGCSDSITKPITVRDEVSADFNYTSACINVPISFTDNSIAPSPNNSNTRNWSFFPGTATGLTASRTYSTAGTRNVMLKVTGFNGCISTITKQIQVSLPPDADFNSSIICVGDSFQLTDVSLPINGTINSWQWKDANTVFSNTQNPKYILNTVGNKNIFLQVTNDEGCIDTITKSVFANPLPDASFDIGPSIYLFTDSPITFTPALTSATNYFWTFSDGNSYSDQNLSLPFTNEGSYNVNLAITNNLGCRNNSLQPYTVARRNTDLGIIAARSTIDNDGFVGVEADLFNYGSSPITTFEILYELTGGGIMKETWVVDTLPPAAVLLFKFSAKSFLNVNERKNAISCIKILTVNNVIDDNISNNENCAALNSDKQLVAEPFPNPADGDVTLPIVLTEDKTINITIYDYLGKLIAENLAYEGVTGLNFIKIPSANYSSGTYTLKISISDNNYIRKLIKQGANK
jgi:PKD repeat protein